MTDHEFWQQMERQPDYAAFLDRFDGFKRYRLIPRWDQANRKFEHIMPEQEARYEGDAWEETIKQYLDLKPRVTVVQVAKQALGVETPKIGTADQRRIAAVLTNLGWSRDRRGSVGERWWSKT